MKNDGEKKREQGERREVGRGRGKIEECEK